MDDANGYANGDLPDDIQFHHHHDNISDPSDPNSSLEDAGDVEVEPVTMNHAPSNQHGNATREYIPIPEDDNVSSFDSDPSYWAGTTPPRNHREEKRQHLRSRQAPKPPRLVIPRRESRDSVPKTFNTGPRRSLVKMDKVEEREAFVDPVLGSTAMQQKRKSITIERNQQREYKHSAITFEGTEVPNVAVPLNTFLDPLPSPVVKVDSNIFFRSLNTQSESKVSQSPPPSPKRSKSKKHSIGKSYCSEDRISFHKIFSEMIRIGSAKKEGSMDGKNFVGWQENSHHNDTVPMAWNQLLWLELKASQNGLTMLQEDQRLVEAREMISSILQAILIFKFIASPSKSRGPTKCTLKRYPRTRMLSSTTGLENTNQGDTGSDSDRSVQSQDEPLKTCNACSTPFINRRGSVDSIGMCMPLSAALTNYIQSTRQAWKQVTSIMEQLEEARQLYPTLRALQNDYPLYRMVGFSKRIETLCLWLNITSDLNHKLEQAALMLGVIDIEGVFWPFILEEEPDEEQVTLNEIHTTQKAEAGVIKPHARRLFDVKEASSSIDSTDTEDTTIEKEVESPPPLEINDKDVQVPKKRTRSVTFDIQDSDSNDVDDDADDEREASPRIYSEHSTPTGKSPVTDESPRLGRIFSQCHFSFDYNSATSMYRPFVDRSLKHSGLRRMTDMLYILLGKTLQRTKQVLQKPTFVEGTFTPRRKHRPSSVDFDSVSGHPLPFTSPITEEAAQIGQQQYDILSTHGAWSEAFIAMGLPSFTPAYLFLLRIPLDVMHECLRFRLEHKPAVDPSAHSIQQLIYECKEVIRSSVHMKQYYQSMASAVMPDDTKAQEHAESDIEEYENDLQEMLRSYFEYLHSWIQMLQRLPQASISLKNILDDEWDFTKEICPHVRGGEAQAGKRFCIMAKNVLLSIGDYLDDGVTDVSSSHQDSQSHGDTMKRIIINSCKRFKLMFHEVRERASKALGFAKMLRKDLEIAAEFQRTVPTKDLLRVLKTSDHIKVKMGADIPGHLMFVPKHLKDDILQILQLLDDLCGREDMPLIPNDPSSMDSVGYLLLVRCSDGGEDGGLPEWKEPCVHVTPDVETTIALSDIQVKSLLLVVNHSSQLHGQRKAFERAVGKAVTLTSDQTSSHNTIAEALDELKQDALGLCHTIVHNIKQVDQNLDIDSVLDIEETEKINMLSYFKDTMHQCFSVSFDYHKEVTRLLSGEARQKLAESVQNLAQMWMSFVLEKCERGRGTRPRWANHGMDFLVVASEPRNVAQLSNEDFVEMTQMMNKCITHIIGTEDKSCSGSPALTVTSPTDGSTLKLTRAWSKSSRSTSDSTPSPHMPSPIHFSELQRTNSIERFQSLMPVDQSSPTEDMSEPSYPKRPTTSPLSPPQSSLTRMFRSISKDSAESLSKMDRWQRIRSKLQQLDEQRNKKLQDLQMIGMVSDRHSHNEVVNINCKKVTFRWQRGRKIGEGQCGTTVYSCINMDSGETLAMKELRFQRNDHSVIKDIADEIKNFEGIRHPSLVRYYGVEIHREELLIFMEYCDEGTIAEVSKAGLPEQMVRRYAQEITVAISFLHEHGIVHRDIKGANVFLSSDGHVKLGDFGCAIKLQNAKTILGELTTFTGTAAYMAPEVITQTGQGKKGYGRAADIWSLGCVVIEMTTGKRPWHEFDHEFPILFKVGEGAIPTIADNLSSECKDFLSKCLVHSPLERWTANQLLDHPFLKVTPGIDFQSMLQTNSRPS
ncbi:mitogen-activated protein kinase kinase kinase 4-like isoform X1 [Patiria miniata]|uniref:Protein kinase domain-containing protein n=1 Tax=Patiria miniata TaxID=46514 RepID=A0A913ZB03_PATMI|nr:mitogen-activated protein kinase kinase kinase 4-like isoform X1 [Patiria miniata]